jgi:hypothetical protein
MKNDLVYNPATDLPKELSLTTERLEYFEKCHSQVFDEEDIITFIPNLDLDDTTYLKLVSAQKKLSTLEQVLAQIKCIESAIALCPSYIDKVEQDRLLTTITVTVPPELAYKIICDCSRSLESLLISTKTKLNKL